MDTNIKEPVIEPMSETPKKVFETKSFNNLDEEKTDVEAETKEEPELTPEEKAAQEKAAKRKAFLKNWDPHPERKIFGRKVGRNERCPCGSGGKFKHCHGKV